MRSLICIFLITLSILSCAPNSPKIFPKQVEQDTKQNISTTYQTKIIKGVYVDPAFSDIEQNEIFKGINELTISVQHIVEFKFFEYNINLTSDLLLSNGFIITKAKSTDLLIINLQSKLRNKKEKLMGYYYTKSLIPMALIVSDKLKLNDYKKVTIHELLHSLGANHVSDSSALMYEYIDGDNTGCLTELDFVEFCNIYECDYRSFKACNN